MSGQTTDDERAALCRSEAFGMRSTARNVPEGGARDRLLRIAANYDLIASFLDTGIHTPR